MRSWTLVGLVALAGCQAQEPAAPVPSDPPAPAVASAAPETRPMPPIEKRFRASGTEPFWSVETVSGTLRYSDPERPSGIAFAASATRQGTGMVYAGTMDGKAVRLVIEPGQCSDGMSETSYAWKAALTIAGTTQQGCASEL